MFNHLLQDKALREGKFLEAGSYTKRPLAKSLPSTPASSASIGDLKGKCQADPLPMPS
ncbi:UNVERIFIED_CONTAM: hypothetical protein Sindi_2567300, partial [Sesamum indicum]